MSHPTKLQKGTPFRSLVYVRRNRKLPPITQKLRPIEPNEIPSSPLSVPSPNIESEAPTTSPTPTSALSAANDDDFWTKLHEHIANQSRENINVRGRQKTSNKVVRIFVSSTFTDFFNEREVLIKKVFPALRDEMEASGIQIIDCDLRWGVPKDSTTEQTIQTCMEELDRCLEDNGQPFFIGLVSDKYGWVPKLEELPTFISKRYRWIPGASITLMEFIHGAFRTHNPNACFLIRNSENLLRSLPEKFRDKFIDKDEYNRQKVQELKSELFKIVSPEQVFYYDCSYGGIDSSTGRDRVKLDGLHKFEEQAKQYLSDAIRNWYPSNFNSTNEMNTEQQKMKTFLLNKTQFYIERPSEFSSLVNYVTGNHDGLELLIATDVPDGNNQPLLAVIGHSGDGKSTLLGKFALYLEENYQNRFFLFYYFFDGASHFSAAYYMFTSLRERLHKYFEENNILSPTTGERFKINDENFLSEAVKTLPIPLLIIIDGLDKGDIHHTHNYDERFPFSNMSELLNEHTFIIISTEIASKLHETMKRYSHFQLKLQPFTVEQCQQYIEQFFRRFNKTLEKEQTSVLLNNKGCDHPLYLSYICENLRQFGDYSLVTNRLKAYPQTIDELINFLLNEVYEVVENKSLVDGLLKLLVTSGIGILESDIVNLLSAYLNVNVNENDQVTFNQMTWATLRRHTKSFLDETWTDGHQLIILRHASLEQLIEKRCLKDNVQEQRSLHRFLAEFYAKTPSIKEFAAHRIPYHYEHAHLYKELVTFLRSSESRFVNRIERQTYLRKHRCTQNIGTIDNPFNQRAYICHVCAMQFKLGPYTMAKSTCFICTCMIMNANAGASNPMKREARVCQKHGSNGYPIHVHCAVCRVLRTKPDEKKPTITDPIPLNICLECWINSGVLTRCCGLDLD